MNADICGYVSVSDQQTFSDSAADVLPYSDYRPDLECGPSDASRLSCISSLATVVSISIMPPSITQSALPPKGTRGRQWSRTAHAQQQQLRRAAPRPPPKKMTVDDVEALRRFMKAQLGGKEPREVQVDLAVAQEERKDGLGQLPTGHGKTYIAAAPYALKKNMDDKRVTLMVSPLIGLQDEMVSRYSFEDMCSL